MSAPDPGTGPGAQPLRILITALGGEGGGVLMNWIVAAARAAGHGVQATSVPGVAQRTGSTTYYMEIAPAGAKGTGPVLSLVPMPGRVDVVLASELVEAARALAAGFVSPRLTTLIASTHRVHATAEKIHMGDGRYDADAVRRAAQELSLACHLHDLDALARGNGTFISATLFGALAGSGVLPWGADLSRGVLGSGEAAAPSRAGFDAGLHAVTGPTAPAPAPPARPPAAPEPQLPAGHALDDAPGEVRHLAALGHQRVCDYQDTAYGALYLDRVAGLLAAGGEGRERNHALAEASRRLALWMAYEDVARVADLKTRPERFRRIAAEVELAPGQVLRVTDYLKPRAEEVADVMPVAIGRRIMARVERGKGLPLMGRGLHLQTTGILGYHALRAVAQLRRLRRRSLRYQREQAAIEDWLAALRAALPRAPAFAAALAELPRVLKGYSDTQARGQRAHAAIMDGIVLPAIGNRFATADANALRRAISAALADEGHAALDALLATAPPPSTQPKGAAHVY